MSIDPENILNTLLDGARHRTQSSLKKLHETLSAHYAAGETDFCIATIGRLSKANGGIGAVSIRNKSGHHYRKLIEAWATKANVSNHKPSLPNSRKREVPSDHKLLERLDDPAMRVLFGQIIAERNSLKRENKFLKHQTEIVVDMRSIDPHPVPQDKIEVYPSLTGILTSMEIDALRVAVADEHFEQQGWWVNQQTGQVKDQQGRQIFKHGFVNAIRRTLREI